MSWLVTAALLSAAATAQAQQQPPAEHPARLFFLGQPHGAAANAPFSAQLALADANGIVVASAGDVTVTIMLENNPSGGALSGTLTQSASGGIAIFRNLAIDAAGQGYTLRATADIDGVGLTAVSHAFSIYLPTSISLGTPPAPLEFGGSETFAATVAPCQADYGGTRGKMEFSLGPLSLTTPITDANSGCRARATLVLADPRLLPGPYGLAAAFYPSNPNYGFSRRDAALTVAPGNLAAEYAGETLNLVAAARAPARLAASVRAGSTPGLFDRLNHNAKRLTVAFLDCSAAPCKPLGVTLVRDAAGVLGAGAAVLPAPLSPGVHAITARVLQTEPYFVSSSSSADGQIAATVSVAVVVAPPAAPGIVGAGSLPDASSANGKSFFGFSFRFDPRSSSLSGSALLVFPSVFQAVPASVQIWTDGPARAVWVSRNEVRLTTPARIEILDQDTGAVLAGSETAGPARLTMIVAAGPPAGCGFEVLNPDGTFYKLIGTFTGGRLSPVPISRGRIVLPP